jgi:glycosyltransferase involved in cell wall biosynthesis
MFDVAPEKVTVVHHGYEKLPEIGSKVEKVNIDRPFLLFVGHRGGYKNFKGMLLAVASRKELRKDFDIIAFGGPAFNASEIDLIHKAGLRDGSVHQISGGDAILGQLYREASAFVYPSLYEGFGLPLLEAMAHGCPVVSSNTSSMPEVVGQAGEYFSPIDIGEQADAICNVVFDLSRREGLVHLGNEQLNNFSWRKCAEETLDLYKNF